MPAIGEVDPSIELGMPREPTSVASIDVVFDLPAERGVEM